MGQSGIFNAKNPNEIIDNIMTLVYFKLESVEAKRAQQEMLRILLDDPALVVEQYRLEHVLSNIRYHGVRIDVWAQAGSGRQLAPKLKRVTDGETYLGAALEEATTVVRSLPAGQPYGRGDLQWTFAASGLTHISALSALGWSLLRFLGL